MADDIVSKRIFVGGLGIDVTEKDLSEKFCRFGKISGLDLKQRKDDKGIYYIDFFQFLNYVFIRETSNSYLHVRKYTILLLV